MPVPGGLRAAAAAALVLASIPAQAEDVLTGDWGGRRTKLEESGILLGADSIDEVLGTGAGGVRRTAFYEGRLEWLATLDLDKLFAWSGANLHANAYQIRGRGVSGNALGGNLETASNIEAARATRLFDLWIEQVLANGSVSVRAGRIAADDEFFTSLYAGNFINATFGWPAIAGADLPNGGPAYPFATPGLRLKYAPSAQVSLQAAVFNGVPTAVPFRIGGEIFAIAEASLAENQDPGAAGFPAAYKLGAWFHSGRFADQRLPRRHDRNWAVYAVMDQALSRTPGTVDQGYGAFLRLSIAPGDRNLIALYGDAGLTLKGPFGGRGDDIVGMGVALAKISDRARALDQDVRRLTGILSPVRDGEVTVEVTYHYQATPWWALQPDLQFVIHPGGAVALPGDPTGTRRIPNAFVYGLRSSMIF